RAKAATARSRSVWVRSSMAIRYSCLGERPVRRLADLSALQEELIRDDASGHRLADRHRADADARVVTALGRNFGLVAVAIDGLARRENGGGRLHREPRHHRSARGDAA